MIRLKVKHKLLVIWLGSIILALSVMMGLFRYQLGVLHEENAHTTITEAFGFLTLEIDTTIDRAHESADVLARRDTVVASMSMISRYQDPKNYQPDIFDPEKRRLAQDLAQHAAATGMDILTMRDAKGVLNAFYISERANGQGAGFVSFDRGEARIHHLQDLGASDPGLPEWAQAVWTPRLIDDVADLQSYELVEFVYGPGQNLAINDQDTIVRERSGGALEVVGYLNSGTVLGDDFFDSLERQTGLSLVMATPVTAPWPDMPGLSPASLLDGTVAMLREGESGITAHSPLDTDVHFVGAAKVKARGAPDIAFAFVQRKDALQSTLAAFQDVVLLVLALSALVVVPVGVFFLNTVITRPVGQLMVWATAIREGNRQNISMPSGKDEFSDLAHAFQDMADAVEARETALKNSQTGLKKAQRIAKLGNWELDFETEHIQCSEVAHAILGTVPGDVEGYLGLFMERIHPDDRPIVLRRFERTRETGEPLSLECRALHPNGTERFVVLQGEYNAKNGAPKLIATIQDITERHILERAKSELISTVSHELRTPLTSIAGTLGLATGGVLGELPDKLKSMLVTANTNAKRLGALIDDLLDMEKIANGTMAMHMKPLSIPIILEQARDANQAYADTFDAAIVIEGALPDVKIHGDEKRLAQVMSNLLSNAAKFSPEGGEIRIGAEAHNGQVTISVRDQGPGIPEAFEPRMFERFAQADQSLTRADQKGGTGLGLSITKSIVELHDGTIDFSTVREPNADHGTTFTVTLPEWREETPMED